MQHESGIPWLCMARRFALSVLIKGFLVVFGMLLATGVLEVALRVYNPIESRVRGDQIVLPAGRKYELDNRLSDQLDPTIIHTKNSLGFRGDEPPRNFDSAFTVVTIGGSTTESFYISDSMTWSDVLADGLAESFENTWVNNAGLDGHSTYGHLVLVDDYITKMRPDLAIFLLGANDRGRSGLSPFEQEQIKSGISSESIKAFAKSLVPYSEVASLVVNIYRSNRARLQGLIHVRFDLEAVERVPLEASGWLELEARHRELFLPGYERRLIELINLSRSNGIEPVFLTQPALYGNAIDDRTGVDLRTVPVTGISGQRAWDVLELYNQVTKSVGEREGVLVIDLASKLDKSSRYFYDLIHYSNEGSAKVGQIILARLCPFISANFSVTPIRPCLTR